MTELVLKKNVLELNSECILQNSGTAIGTKMAQAYANIVMSMFERNLLTCSYGMPLVRLRYIDDIFAILTYGEDKVKDFLPYINSIHSSFQVTATSCQPGKINKIDNELLYDHLFCHNIDYILLCIVDMIHIGNNTESQLNELLRRKERK